MVWTPLAERFASLPLLLAGPMLRRVEPDSVTVWFALKEARTVTLRIYCKRTDGALVEQLAGTGRTVRVGDNLHVLAVTAWAAREQQKLAWGEQYYYDLFFRAGPPEDEQVPATEAHLETPGILSHDPASADDLHRLVYPGQPLPSFVLPPEDLNQLRIMHGSCRKPHGTGKDMLAALDTILETLQENSELRPQQLFLTGDQIYADDVASPLLYSLIDAGGILFAGNQEEILPLVNVPASKLLPNCRTSAVRNRAMLTTTTPRNHLMSLAEYMGMYLFCWSDVLWPDDLPTLVNVQGVDATVPKRDAQTEEQYAEVLNQLREFQSTLPHVRRALANIAVYTICDDHDVTDDWFLDGAWCQQVLHSKLGRRVVRNAMEAYALCQAWGNTPEQFERSHGKAFLKVVDTWRGEESERWEESLCRYLDLPKSFKGKGELPHSGQGFQWHYLFQGPSYQMIVLDTRTHRHYEDPHDFPGLLSPEAMKTQIAAAMRTDVEATILISATPVIGQDFIESVQFWSHWNLRSNYAMDREAWALNWSTFQSFLKLTSLRKRVVILSGDVHYAFGSSLAYWGQDQDLTARIVNFTSSSLHNEVAGPEMAVLTTIYPQLLHLLGKQESTLQADFLAWDIGPSRRQLFKKFQSIIWRRIAFIWWSLPKLIDALRSHTEIVMPARGWPTGAFKDFPPDRIYRVNYLDDELDRLEPAEPGEKVTFLARLQRTPMWTIELMRSGLQGINFLLTGLGRTRNSIARRTADITESPDSHIRRHSVRGLIRSVDYLGRKLEKRKNSLSDAIFHRQEWLQEWKAGTHIIGYTNIGEIVFRRNANGKQEVLQRLWWYPHNSEKPAPATEFCETLNPPDVRECPPLP